MGIYDRDYYRREGPSFLGTLTNRAPVCKWLIVINLVLFIAQLATLERDAETHQITSLGAFTEALDLNAGQVLHQGQVWRLLTHAFLHSPTDIWHIVFNMLFLWWLGHELEEMYGSREFLTLYLLSAVVAGACFVAYAVTMPFPVGAAVGASGAISAVTVIFACHWPHRTVLLMFLFPVPIWVLVAIYLGWDFLVFVMGVRTTTGVAAHLGGALFGYLYYKNQWRFSSLFSGLSAWRKKRAKPRLRIYREEEPAAVASTRAPAEHEIDEHFEAKLDAVLEKMNLVGKDNLTDHEKEILLKASEIYRRRRT
jgi:membrane associated rhomboid family serine protease